MSDVVIYEQASVKLRDVLLQLSAFSELKQILESRDLVLSDYPKIFSIKHLPFFTEGEFRSFLLFDQNRYWKEQACIGRVIFALSSFSQSLLKLSSFNSLDISI
jgi:hypothetical protein